MAFEIENKVLVRYEDEGAETVTVPGGVEIIGEYAFTGAENLKSVILPEGIVKIEQYAFWNCLQLKNICFPKSLESVARFAFWGCESLEAVKFYNNLKTLGNAVFRECDMLKTAELPDNMADIGSSAFSNCISLESVVIPKGIKIIKQRAFYGCLALKRVFLPDGLEAVDEYAFESCRLLDAIELPGTVASIGRHAFDTCRALKNIKIPKSVTYIGSSAFINTALVNGCESDFVTGGDGILIQYIGNSDRVNVPEGIKTVGERAFSYKKDIKEICLPVSVENIGEYAFESCEVLESISFCEGVKVLGAHAFSGCKSLESIRLPQSLLNIGADVFFDTPLLNGCEGDMLVLDKKYLIKYKGSDHFPVIPEGVEYIGGGAFANCDAVRKIDIPHGVKGICASAFEWCSGLESVNIPESTIFIGANAFAHCGGIKAKICYNGEKTVETDAFYRGAEIEFVSGNGSFSVRLKNNFVSDENTALLNKFAAGLDTAYFDTMTELLYKMPVAISLIENDGVYRRYIAENSGKAVCYVLENDRPDFLSVLTQNDLLKEEDAELAVDKAIELNKTEMQTALLHYRHEKWGDSAEERIDKKFEL